MTDGGKDFIIRPALPSDLDALVGVWWQLSSEHAERDGFFWGLHSEREVKEDYRAYKSSLLQDPDHFHLVAERDGKIIGFIHGWVMKRPGIMRTDKTGRVDELVVEAAHRGKGAGRDLLETLETAFRGMGLECMDLMVDFDNEKALALYRSAGLYEREYHMIKKLG